MREKSSSQRSNVVFAALTLILAVAVASPALAQDTTVYPTKFVCGFEQGNVPLLNDPNPYPHEYEELKPGNYATVIDITSLTLGNQNVSIYVNIEDDSVTPPSDRQFLLGFFTIFQFHTIDIGCVEIIQALENAPFNPLNLNGEAIEGMVMIFSAVGDPLDVTAAYSYSSQNAFERHAVWGLSEDLSTFALLKDSPFTFGLLEILGSIPDALPEPKQLRPVQDLAASGAGGLGLGASVDIEKVPGRAVTTGTGTAAQLQSLMEAQR